MTELEKAVKAVIEKAKADAGELEKAVKAVIEKAKADAELENEVKAAFEKKAKADAKLEKAVKAIIEKAEADAAELEKTVKAMFEKKAEAEKADAVTFEKLLKAALVEKSEAARKILDDRQFIWQTALDQVSDAVMFRRVNFKKRVHGILAHDIANLWIEKYQHVPCEKFAEFVNKSMNDARLHLNKFTPLSLYNYVAVDVDTEFRFK